MSDGAPGAVVTDRIGPISSAIVAITRPLFVVGDIDGALAIEVVPAIDTAGPPPDAPTYVAPFQWMSQWDVDTSLVQGGALDETASVPTVETNPQWVGTTWALQWNKQLSLWQNSALDVPAVVVVPPPDAPVNFAPLQWMSQWDVDTSLVQGGALDETMPATETNVHFIPYGWRYSWASQWSLQASLLQGTAQDFSSVAPTNLLLLRTLMGTGL